MRLPLLSSIALAVLLVTPAHAGPTVTTGVHSVGSLVLGGGKHDGAPARAGLATGVDLALGDDDSASAVALVAERLWRFPDAYPDAAEDTLTVEYRALVRKRDGRRRNGYIAFGAGVRRVDSSDDLGAYRLHGYDFRVHGAFALKPTGPTELNLRVGLTYGCYTRGTRDDATAMSVSCLETLLGQMLVGLELARRF